MSESKRNYLLLGASILLVGVFVEIISRLILAYPMKIIYKTLLLMLMIAVGYSFAEGVIAKFAAKFLKSLQKPFVRTAGDRLGKVLFYVVIYVALFFIYLGVFIYNLI